MTSCSSARSQRWQPPALYRTTRGLRIEAPRDRRVSNPPHREPVGRQPHARLALVGDTPGLVECARRDVSQLRVDLVLLPEVLLEALHPLEVRDDDTARVREHVG